MTLNSVAINKLSYIESHSTVQCSERISAGQANEANKLQRAGKEVVVVEYPVQLIHHQQ